MDEEPEYADPKFAKQLQKRYEKHGSKNITDQLKTLEKNIKEHEDKIIKAKETGGYTSSMEREVWTFKKQLETTKKFIKDHGLE